MLVTRTVLCSAALTLCLAVTARAQAPLEDTPIPMWVPDGAVADVVKVGNTLVVGGRFEYVGPPTGPFAIVDAADATSFSAGAGLTGSVHKVIADGSGGWFALQDPFAVGGPGGALVHINSGGERDPNFVAPATGGRTIAVEAGRLFVATFVSGPGGLQERLLALDPATGGALPWAPAVLPTNIDRLVAGGGVLYVNSSRSSGATLSTALAFDATTGATVPFPALQDSEVVAVADNRVYVVTKTPTTHTLSAYTADGQRVTTFPDVVYTAVNAVEASPTHVFVAARTVGGPLIPTQVVALDANTGALAWTSPTFSYLDLVARDGGLLALAVEGNTLFVGGQFTRAGGQARTRMAAFDATSGTLLPWAPSVGGIWVSSIAATSGRVAFGGLLRSVGGIVKRGIVSLDLTTGRPTAVQPPDSSYVTALAASGDLVVAATSNYPFNVVPEVFAYSAATGTRYPKVLPLNGAVTSMAIHGPTLFLGGAFSGVDGQARQYLAAYDLVAGQLRPWNPSPDNFVRKLKVHGGALYAVGLFRSLIGLGRSGAVAFDLNTLEATSWNPQHGGSYVVDTDAWQDRIFLGVHVRDEFQQTPPFSVVKTIAVDRFSGALLNVDLPVGTDIAQVGGTLVVSGNGRINTRPDTPLSLATFDGTTGQALPWTPSVIASEFSDNGEVLIGLDGHLAVLGPLSVGGRPFAGLAVFKPRLVLPGAPRQIQMSVVGSTVSLAWSPGAAPAPLGYVIEAGSAPGLSDLGRFPVGGATQVAAVVAPGSYGLRVRAVGASGEGPASSEWRFTTPATPTPPGAPSSLVTSVAGNVVYLAWTAGAGNATTYIVEGGSGPGLSNLGVIAIGSLDTAAAGAVPPGTYYLRVRAANAVGSSPPSNEVAVVVP